MHLSIEHHSFLELTQFILGSTSDDAPMSHCVSQCVYKGPGSSDDSKNQSEGQGGVNNVLGGGLTDVVGTVTDPVKGALGQ